MSPDGQVSSGKLPYDGERDSSMTFRIASGGRPPRPTNPSASRQLPDKVWDVIQGCWAQNPQSRLTIHSLYRELTSPEKEPQGGRRTPFPENGKAKHGVVRSISELIFGTHFQE